MAPKIDKKMILTGNTEKIFFDSRLSENTDIKVPRDQKIIKNRYKIGSKIDTNLNFLQKSSKIAQHGSKMAARWSNIAPRWSNIAPRWSNIAPR